MAAFLAPKAAQPIQLSGIIPNQDEGNGTLVFVTPGIQNGAPDGVALVDADGDVVQFLSYEGSFTATSGPANGLTSTDIGVSQSGSEPSTLSLQLKGNGSDYADFEWTAASTSSFGSLNDGQDFVAVNPNGTFRIADAAVNEGNAGTTPLSFTVTRSGGSAGAAAVHYGVSFGAGTGQANAADLGGATSGTVTFADGTDQDDHDRCRRRRRWRAGRELHRPAHNPTGGASIAAPPRPARSATTTARQCRHPRDSGRGTSITL